MTAAEKTALARAEREEHRFVELINGTVFYLFARPAGEHLDVEGNIYGVFKRYLKGKKCKTFFEMEVWLDKDKNHYQPDVIIVCDPDKLKDHKRVQGAPDLVVEILSPGTRNNDRGDKLHAYEEHGVKEYWIVDPIARTVEVYLLSDGRLKLDYTYCAEYEPDNPFDEIDKEYAKFRPRPKPRTSIHVSLYDDLDVPVADVFEGLDFWDKKQ